MLTNYVYRRFSGKTLIKCMVVLFTVGFQSAAMADGTIFIKGATETTIITNDHTYLIAPEARIYDQNGKKIKMDQFPAPCMARVTFEPRQGHTLPLVLVINIKKVLPDPALPRNHMSTYPE